ncbi:MAG: hypothetical protein Q7T17_02485 [Microbacterium sp.]|uniref:hypothetical protein n=1 Tax=Microbacterium sp. TaxID=51671 RepID=UPI00271CD0F4|nr:hypothetical protein [Microbacterium sp.]MDO8381838.1 hypothetical protein [Microbacterium sp.]
MKISPFTSEFPPAALPAVTGSPLGNAQLDQHGAKTAHSNRAERAQQIAIGNAVHGFYLAKRYSEQLAQFHGWTNALSERAVTGIEAKLWRLAVVDVAMVNDTNKLSRSASLPSVLAAMKQTLDAAPDAALDADRSTLQDMRDSINADTVVPLMYVRHLRNKWAGHPSMDRDFDDWADADQTMSIPLIEEALAILVRAHQEAADLSARCSVLAPLFEVPAPTGEVVTQPDGTVLERFPMTVQWSNVTALADDMRFGARRDAEALFDQMASPPGYGGREDRDWSAGSEHARRRATIDDAAAQVMSKATTADS